MIFSIDIGSKGCMTILDDKGKYINSIIYSLIQKWYDKIINYDGTHTIIIEKVHAMPKQGVVSMFNFGRKLGEVEALCEVLNIEPEWVTPQEWKKYFGLIGKNKKESCNKALKLEPTLPCIGSKGGCLDGVADSYLIGKYWIERNLKCQK